MSEPKAYLTAMRDADEYVERCLEQKALSGGTVARLKPYYEEAGITIYCGDCREILPLLPNVDLVLTDPPYLIHAGAGGGAFGNRDHLINTGGFTDGGVSYDFLRQHRNWFCFCSRRQLPLLLAVAQSCERWNLLTWCKPNPVPTCNNKYLPDVEYAVHGFASGRLFGDMSIKSCFTVHPCGNKETIHPNEKPLAVVSKLMRLGTRPGDTVLDPFMGTGTTLRAAKDLGRRAIGIEINRHYCDIAMQRLRQETLPFSDSNIDQGHSQGQMSMLDGVADSAR